MVESLTDAAAILAAAPDALAQLNSLDSVWLALLQWWSKPILLTMRVLP
jgi:hypothetical protein